MYENALPNLIACLPQVIEHGRSLWGRLSTLTHLAGNTNTVGDTLLQTVAATNDVLQQLNSIFTSVDDVSFSSLHAVTTTRSLADNVSGVFRDLDKLVLENEKCIMASSGLAVVQKSKRPFIESEYALVQVNLERLKSNLLVVLHAIMFAKQFKK